MQRPGSCLIAFSFPPRGFVSPREHHLSSQPLSESHTDRHERSEDAERVGWELTPWLTGGFLAISGPPCAKESLPFTATRNSGRYVRGEQRTVFQRPSTLRGETVWKEANPREVSKKPGDMD